MAACGSCQNRAVPASSPAPLFQIRHGYRTRWNDLAFSVETDSGDWTLRVQDSRKQTLYTAHRSGARAAQLAAAEFAVFRVLGHETRVSPERLVKELQWQEHW